MYKLILVKKPLISHINLSNLTKKCKRKLKKLLLIIKPQMIQDFSRKGDHLPPKKMIRSKNLWPADNKKAGSFSRSSKVLGKCLFHWSSSIPENLINVLRLWSLPIFSTNHISYSHYRTWGRVLYWWGTFHGEKDCYITLYEGLNWIIWLLQWNDIFLSRPVSLNV